MCSSDLNADHRLRVPTSQVQGVAALLAAELIKLTPNADASVQALLPALAKLGANINTTTTPAANKISVKPRWIEECAKDLAKPENRGKVAVLAGYRQPAAVHLIAHAINAALGSFGTVVVAQETEAPAGTLAELAASLNANQVDTLVILGGNPVYTAPADLDWAVTQRKAQQVVRLSYYEDETSEKTDLHLPAAHYLESWGDARTRDGSVVAIQPLIAPLFGGLTESEVLGLLHKHRIEKVLVVGEGHELKGLVTVKDSQKATERPRACKDEGGRLRVGAAVGTSPDTVDRVEIGRAHV